jgi:hypothetical protein
MPASNGLMPAVPWIKNAPAVMVLVQASICDAEFKNNEKVNRVLSPKTIR